LLYIRGSIHNTARSNHTSCAMPSSNLASLNADSAFFRSLCTEHVCCLKCDCAASVVQPNDQCLASDFPSRVDVVEAQILILPISA
jgi:hypothetical protein